MAETAGKNRIIRIIALILTLVMTVSLFSSCELFEDVLNEYLIPEDEAFDSDGLKVVFLDVGQGDSILLMTKNSSMLIDAGVNDMGKNVVNRYLDNAGIKKLDYVVATHAHADHIGGLDEVINHVEVGTVFMVELPDKLVPSTAAYRKLVEAILDSDADVISPEAGYKFSFDSVKVTVLGPVGDYDNLNDSSIVLRVDYGETSFLFTGDCEKSAFKRIIKSGANVEADVLKLAHHGSNNATDQVIIDAVNPECAVASCGEGNDYGHPHKEVLTLMKKNNLTFYRTDKNGTVTMISDGESITVKTEKGE